MFRNKSSLFKIPLRYKSFNSVLHYIYIAVQSIFKVLIFSLRAISLDVASPLVATNRTLPSVEQCRCPEGYAGLSCEVRDFF